MKKCLVIAAVLLFFGLPKLMAGDEIAAPASRSANPINADYGGVDIWLSSFSTVVSTVGLPVTTIEGPQGTYGTMASTTTASKRQWRIYGAYFSTGNCGANDYIEVFQSTGSFGQRGNIGSASIAGGASAQSLRFYNVNGSTATTGGGTGFSCSGFTPLRWPIRLYGNVFMQPSSNGYNSQGILYYKEPE